VFYNLHEGRASSSSVREHPFSSSTRRGAAYRQIILKYVLTPSLTGADGGRFRLIGVEGALAELAGLVTCEEHGVQDQQE
jgi:hypothetical protein